MTIDAGIDGLLVSYIYESVAIFLNEPYIMKLRQSVKYANWIKTREEWYKKKFEEILFRTKSELIINNEKVCLKNDTEESLLLNIDNPKSQWFQIWLKLK